MKIYRVLLQGEETTMDINKVADYSSVNSQVTRYSNSVVNNTVGQGNSNSSDKVKAVDVSNDVYGLAAQNRQPVSGTSSTVATNATISSITGEEVSALEEARRKLKKEQAAEQQEQRDAAALERARAALEHIKSRPLALRFDTAEDYNDAKILRVVDAHSDELIRQIPSEELLRVSAMISSYKERVAQEEMTTDPQLKSKGITTPAQASENLRGVVFDDVI